MDRNSEPWVKPSVKRALVIHNFYHIRFTAINVDIVTSNNLEFPFRTTWYNPCFRYVLCFQTWNSYPCNNYISNTCSSILPLPRNSTPIQALSARHTPFHSKKKWRYHFNLTNLMCPVSPCAIGCGISVCSGNWRTTRLLLIGALEYPGIGQVSSQFTAPTFIALRIWL